MTDKQTPADWVLIEAAKRSGWGEYESTNGLRIEYGLDRRPFTALCDMIERYETPPVDRKVLCAREAAARTCQTEEYSKAYLNGNYDDTSYIVYGIRAIELYEEGFGK